MIVDPAPGTPAGRPADRRGLPLLPPAARDRLAIAQRLYLVGFMACGKTAVGEILAARLGYRFLDLDAEIEARAGATVRQIFEQPGEAAFRDLEHRALAETASVRRAVIATGGGLMTFERNRSLVRRLGASVWLDPSFDTLLARLGAEGRAQRPLFGDPPAARELHRRRLDAYRRADIRIGIDADETAPEVAARISAFFEGAPCDT